MSIGTSLAMETLGRPTSNDDREIPPLVNGKSSYRGVLISVNTLIINIIAAMVNKDELVDTASLHRRIAIKVDEEIAQISKLISSVNPKWNVVFYITSHKDLPKLLGEDKIRKPKGLSGLRHEIYLSALDVVKNQGSIRYEHIHGLFPSFGGLARGSRLITFTSFITDLLINERSCVLLEPHTGVMKQHPELYTKFYPVPKHSMLRVPFNRVSWGILGDKHLIKGDPIKIRREFIELIDGGKMLYNTPLRTMINYLLSNGSKELQDSVQVYRRIK